MPTSATRRQPRESPVYRTALVKAPVGGMNSRDSIADMPTSDAVRMVNMWPTTLDVMLREGYENHATGITGEVDSLVSYNKNDGTKELFAAAVDKIYDVTAGGAVGAAVVSGLTSDRWQHTMFSTIGGQFMYLVNGADDPLLYDGTTWTPINGASTPAITGVTTNTLIHVNVFKTRLWFVQKDTMLVWYLPSGSIGGAATAFDLRSQFMKGGFLRAMGTWTIDAGEGIDDYAIFITSEGEIAVYKGTDPASALTFAKVGTYQVAQPIGYRCLDKYGGDMIVVTRDGLLPLSLALQSNRVNVKAALTDKINSTITGLTSEYGDTFGWETQLFPQQNMLLLNVPVTDGQEQYAMNTITKAWARFQGWDANCWERHGDDVYFGGNGVVGKIWGVPSDNGVNVNGDVLQAFSLFGNAQTKYFKLAKPIINTNGAPNVTLFINVDYNVDAPIGIFTTLAPDPGIWDVGLWDEAVWGGDPVITTDWHVVGDIGTAGALGMKVSMKTNVFRWQATQFVLEDSGGTVL